MATDDDNFHNNELKKLALDDNPKSPSLLPWDRFQNWLHCICIVTFDLELGQAMEV